MLYRFLFLIFFITTCTSSVQATTFPKYKKVVEMLISNTEICKVEFKQSTKLSLEKRIDGYWVGLAIWNFETQEYEISQKQLLWSLKEQSYHIVRFQIEEAINTTIVNQHLVRPYTSNAEEDSYNIHPFFGYQGWYHDVIQFYTSLEKERSLDDFQLYSLGRAYSNYAKALLSDPGTMYYAHSDDFLSEEKASDERISLYNTIETKATDYFYQTYLKNPNKETIVGNIFIKYSNEVLTQYHTLALHGKYKAALKILKGKKLYTKETLAFAGNLLRSCPKDAILWTSGDNTSLPMFYLQQTTGLRKDVLVTDAYQLSLWRYVNYLKNSKIHSKPIFLDLDPTLFYKNNNDYILLKNSPTNLDFKDFETALISDEKYRTFKSKTIQFPIAKKQPLKLNFENNYLLKNEWVSLFIFRDNERPFCFTNEFKFSPTGFSQALGLKEHLRPIGFVCQLLAQKYTLASEEEIEKSYHIITQKLEWPSFEHIKEENIPSFSQYLWSIIALGNNLYNSGKTDKVVYLLDDFSKKFPLSTDVVGLNNLSSFIDLYFKSEVPTKAEVLIEKRFEILLQKEHLSKFEFYFVQRIDQLLQERNINKFNKIIQQLYLKPNDTPPWK